MFLQLRSSGGPSWYGESRTGVVVDVSALLVGLSFGLIFLGFLLVVPGIRRQRLSSALAVALCLALGILLSILSFYPAWLQGSLDIHSRHAALSAKPINARLRLSFGLSSLNITLSGVEERKNVSCHHEYNLNEAFQLDSPQSLKRAYVGARAQGLPYPILCILEILSVQGGSIAWGRDIRMGGYYASIFLWTSVGIWALLLLCLAVLPAYFSRALLLLALSILTTHFVYLGLVPKALPIHFPAAGKALHVEEFQLGFGWCFWATLGAGLLCLALGAVLRLLERRLQWSLVTFFQSDFDEVSGSPFRMRLPEKFKTASGQGREEGVGGVAEVGEEAQEVPPPLRLLSPLQARGGRVQASVENVEELLTPGWEIQPRRQGPMGLMESTRLTDFGPIQGSSTEQSLTAPFTSAHFISTTPPTPTN